MNILREYGFYPSPFVCIDNKGMQYFIHEVNDE